MFVNAVAGLHAVPNWSAYLASKAALTELADSLRLEEAVHGVRVTSIYPGGIATELMVLEAPADVDVTEIALQPPPRS